MSIALVLCLALGAIGTYGSVLVPEYEVGALYSGYDGAYAQKYHNYERSYAFEYGVADPHTGDHKTQWETKDKEGTVRGSYSLLEPDGSTRIVDYIADEHGFRAVVKKIGIHGTSVESHGGAEEHAAPQIALAAAPLAHLEAQPTIIEEPVAYKSYDGGYEDYSDLKPVVADVYTKPIEYVQAPKAELIINVPEHHEEYHNSYSEHTPLYPKVSLPKEYWSQEYIPQEKYIVPQEKYIVPQEKYVLPQEKYVLPQEKYVLPQEKYILPQENYVLPQEKYVVPQEKYVFSQEKYVVQQEYHAPAAEYVLSAPKQIQEYVVPEYKIAQEPHVPVPAPISAYKEYQAPVDYHVPQLSKEYVPLEKGAYSYVQEQRYNTPKGKGVFVEGPKVAYVEAPKQTYWAAPSPAVVPSSHAQYNLNVDYHY